MLDIIEINRIKEVLRMGIEKNEVAGANLMIIKDGKEVFYHEDGFADIQEKLPIKRDSIFRMYSMSKPVTSAAVMLLLQQGKIDLFDPISKYLDGFKGQMVEKNGQLVPANREITIKDLLSMTSGLVYGGEGIAGKDTEILLKELEERLFGDSPMKTVEAMNKLGSCTLKFHPGENWEYGLSADVLGALVEVISGMSYSEFLKKEIFDPLEMTDTGFWVSEEKRHRLVKTYKDNGSGSLELYTGNNLGIINKMDRKPAFESGGAGLVSTIDDYAKFTQMLMNNGVQILKPRTIEYMTSAALTTNQQKGLALWETLSGHSYGNLMRIRTECSKAGDLGSLGEYGWDGWLGTYFCNCPKDNLTFLFMIQKTDAGTIPLTRKLRNIVFSSCCD